MIKYNVIYMIKWLNGIKHSKWRVLMSTSLSVWLSHHEAATDIGLEDFIKRAVGVGATVEGEDLRHVPHAVLIMASAFDRQ